jgi:hypothetical protein
MEPLEGVGRSMDRQTAAPNFKVFRTQFGRQAWALAPFIVTAHELRCDFACIREYSSLGN